MTTSGAPLATLLNRLAVGRHASEMSSSPETIDGTAQRAVHEFAVLDLDAELLEIALLARDVKPAAGDEGPFAHAHDIGGPRRSGCAQHGKPRSARPTKPMPMLERLSFI